MSFSILSMDGVFFISRWLHIFFGVIWIGLLYYFNFVQTPFFAEADASTKSGAIQKLVPRALWWFRWGAMFTLITGILLLGIMSMQFPGIFVSPRGVLILIGAAFAVTMWANVWFVIWPAQKVVIANTIATASGQPAIAGAADRGARASVASRTNVLFSLPMLFFMAAASHLPLTMNPDAGFGLLTAFVVVVIGALEVNAIVGKLGPLKSIAGVIHMGLLLTIVMYVGTELLTK